MGMFGKSVMLNGSEVDEREPIGDFSKFLRIINVTSTVWFKQGGDVLLSESESWFGLTIILNAELTAEKFLTPEIQAT